MDETLTTTVAGASASEPVQESPPAESSCRETQLPVTIIQPRSGWSLVDTAEMWRHRELLYFLVWRDIKVRYKQTVLGAAWAILQPFAQMVVFTIFFGRIAQLPSGNVPYSLLTFSGLLPWIFMSTAIQSAALSVVSNQNLVTKIYFPRLFMPLSAIGTSALDFLVSCGMLILLMAYFAVAPTFQLLLVHIVLVVMLMTVIGTGTLLSALIVAFRDVKYVVPFMIQLWMFATPSIYMDASLAISAKWLPLLRLNPAYGLIVCFRAAVLGSPMDWAALATSAVTAMLLMFVGALYFRRVERVFADII
jgi:lipopolysaccharide transport system permease protein